MGLDRRRPRRRHGPRGLPTTLEVQTPLGAALLCHGMGTDDMTTLREHDQGYALQVNGELQRILRRGRHGLVVSGHSHRPLARRLQGIWFVNPGTLFQEHDAHCMVVDWATGQMELHGWLPHERTWYLERTSSLRTPAG